MAVHRLVILAFAALPFLAADASAQTAAQLRTWDYNNDGIITRAEWRGTAQSFANRDMNRDGVLSGIEAWEPDWAPQSADWDLETFTSLDRNQDGLLTRREWRGDIATFRQIDRNRDNQISQTEFLNGDAGYDLDVDVTDFDEIDDNYNGRVERREWRGTRATFERLDRNRDGWLSRRELAANDVAVATSDDGFTEADINHNGVITANEWRSGSAAFNRHDRNRDGVITRAEYDAAVGNGAIDMAIAVDSRQPWTNTGIHVNAGDLVAYQATGTIQMSTDYNDRATANGAYSGRTASNSPRPDQKAGGLLMRIDDSPVTFMGESGSFTAQRSGHLFIGVNDDHFPDNSGEYRVSVSVTRR